MLGFLTAVIISILIAAPAGADDSIKVGEVVVTATRYEQPATDIPANVTVINEETIRNSTARYVPDLLRTEAGVQVNDWTGNGSNITVGLRGFGETAPLNTLVLVDGRKANQPDLSGVDWTQIPLERIKRIEIVRGGRNAVLYGDNAAGGVINIITKEGEKFSAGLDTAVGSFGTFKANGYVSGDVKDKLPFYLSAGTMTSSGYRDNSYTRAQDLGAKVGYYPTSSLKLGLDAGYHKQHTGLPGTLSEADIAGGIPRTGTKTPDDFTNVQDYYLQLLPELSIGGDNLVRMDLSYRKRTFLSYATFSAGNFTGDAGIETITASPQVLFKTQVAKAVNSLTAGLDFLKAKEGIENTSLFYGSLSTGNYDLEKKNYGAYLHDELALTPNLRLSAGYRKDRAEFSFSPSVLSGISLDADAYTAGINYAFSGKSYVYGSYSRSFRYPVFDELYSFFTNTINPSISPQTSNDYEVGMRYYFTDQVYCHVNVFKMDTDDEIFYNPATFNNENMAGATERLGVEASFFAKVLETLSLRGSYTHMNATMNGGAYDGKHVPNVPEHRAALEATYQPSMPLTLVLNGEYVGERPYISDFAHDFSNQGSYVVLNARVEYKYKQAKVFLNVNNLADKKYSEFGAIGDFPLTQKFFPSPGRNFMLGVSAAL